MLYLTLKVGDSVDIGEPEINGERNINHCRVTLLGFADVDGKVPKLGFDANKSIPILREKAGVRTPKKKANPYPEGTPEWHNFEQRNTLTLNKGNC